MQSSWKEGKLSSESDMGCVCLVLVFSINRIFLVNVALDLLNCTWIKRWQNKHWAHTHSCQNFSNRACLGYVNLAQLNEPQGCCFKWVDANLGDVQSFPNWAISHIGREQGKPRVTEALSQCRWWCCSPGDRTIRWKQENINCIVAVNDPEEVNSFNSKSVYCPLSGWTKEG